MDWTEIKELLQHPFYMVIAGTLFWFLMKWSVNRNLKGNGRFNNVQWWKGESDDVLVTLIFGFMMVIWDDELLNLFNQEIAEEGEQREFHRWFYLLPGPMVWAIYEAMTRLKKLM